MNSNPQFLTPGYSLQANAKTKEGSQHPDREAQFRYLNEQAREFRDAGLPVVSVDAMKKELIGEFKNVGREWEPKGEPVEVRVHDFLVPELGKAIPYGVYDVERNVGWVNVGQDHETAASLSKACGAGGGLMECWLGRLLIGRDRR